MFLARATYILISPRVYDKICRVLIEFSYVKEIEKKKWDNCFYFHFSLLNCSIWTHVSRIPNVTRLLVSIPVRDRAERVCLFIFL